MPTLNITQDNNGQPPQMTTQQSTTTAPPMTAPPTEGDLDRIASLEAQMQEIKAMLAALMANQTTPTSAPTPAPTAATPIPTIEDVDDHTDNQSDTRTHPMRNTPGTVRLPSMPTTRAPSLPPIARTTTEDPPNRHKKSTISERITPLSDGIEHTFLQWSASIRDRILVNEDHYPTDISRRALIWGTTTGLAKTYLEPRHLSVTHGFQSAEEMMDLLGSYYLTGDETEQARNLFDDLQMGEEGHATETFSEFKARFQSAAITGQVTESEWFRYMWNKLSPQLRSCVIVMKSQWKGNYQNMVRELSAYDLEWRRNNELDPPVVPIEQTATAVT